MSLKKLIKLSTSKNIADTLDEQELLVLGSKVIEEGELDKNSRAEWFDLYNKIIKIAKQVIEPKTFPFEGASNIKYPLITDAGIRFASRMYPQLIQGNKVVRCAVVGEDPTGDMEEAADAISMHMSSQLLVQSNSWESTMDRLLHMYPITGVAFKKVYYDPIKRKNCTDLCTPEHIIVNDNITSLEEARRITHIVYKHANYIQGMMNLGLYTDIELDKLEATEGSTRDDDRLHELWEQQRYIDLDEDGIQEPYLVTVHKQSNKVLRIAPCFKMKNVQIEKDKIVHIKPTRYFVDYHFIPSPDGKFHSIGYGHLLYPINHSVNSIYNQLVDSGKLANMQGGFLLKGVRTKNGQLEINQGQWNVLDTPSMDLKSSIMEFPTKEPSQTLMKLLEFTLDAGKELGSITDTLQGQGQTQNVPATTIMTMLQQGMIVPTAVQKRLWRSLKEEFELLADLNKEHMDDFDDFIFAGSKYRIYKQYYEMVGISIEPVADPNSGSDTIKSARAQAVLQVAQTLSPAGQQEALELYFKQLSVPEDVIKKLLAPNPNPPPNPDVIKAQTDQQELQLKGQEALMDKMLKRAELSLKEHELKLKEQELSANTSKAMQDSHLDLLQAQHQQRLDVAKAQIDIMDEKLKALDLIIKKHKVDTDDATRREEIKRNSEARGSTDQ